jgi:molybdate transport system permease protein
VIDWFPVLLSLRVASAATLVCFMIGLPLARLSVSGKMPLRGLWEAFILLPMALPPTVLGYLLLLLLGRRGPLGSLLERLGSPVIFTVAAAVIAAVIVSLPLMYQSCKAALRSVDPQYASAARTLGLKEGFIFWRITFPLAAPGIISGVVLSFARALGEFGATLMVAGNIPGRTQTIPLALYSAVEGGRSAEAGLLLGITVALAFILVAIVGWCERRTFAAALPDVSAVRFGAVRDAAERNAAKRGAAKRSAAGLRSRAGKSSAEGSGAP